MRIIKAKVEQIDEMMAIYSQAIKFMAANGNPTQWVEGYPSREMILGDIESGHLHLYINDDEKLAAIFCYYVGEDPTYQTIYNGAWLNDESYGVLHRIASTGIERGVADRCIEWCFAQHPNMRIDTHKDNNAMLAAIRRNGFKPCGMIICCIGTPRLAFQKI
ncbi:MAG: GNAT family N-acetyltransferase [Rikenellaceae bacterium]